jgi:hypothetical protein
MMVKKSPGGSLFPYYYKNGEIHCLKYGSFASNEDALLAIMLAEEKFIQEQGCRLLIWVDFYETNLTNRILVEFIESTNRLRSQIVKLAIVGWRFQDQWRYRYFRWKIGVEFPFPVQFFRDPEIAKTWLVGQALGA